MSSTSKQLKVLKIASSINIPKLNDLFVDLSKVTEDEIDLQLPRRVDSLSSPSVSLAEDTDDSYVGVLKIRVPYR